MTSRLWLIRHGATDWSDEGRFNGWTDVPLNDRGRDLARALRARVAETHFDGVWSSDLSRAVETAKLTGMQAIPDARLRELDFGSIEGRTWDECPAEIRGGLLDFDSFAAPDGESTAQLRSRVHEFLGELEGGDHLLFTHGGVVRALARDRGPDRFVATGELVTLDWAPGLR